ncbi:MAG: hypothetical protein ACRDRJ_42595 [Streptosporangiaceae bacterium]
MSRNTTTSPPLHGAARVTAAEWFAGTAWAPRPPPPDDVTLTKRKERP